MDKNDKLKEKLDLLSALKEDEEATQKIKVIKKENSKKKEVSKQEKDAKKEEVLKEIKKVKDTTPKKNNIPFTIMGIIIIVIFAQEIKRTDDKAFRYIPIAVALSFGFYLPVVLFSGIFPIIGMLMIPKTMAYVWIIWMGWKIYLSQRNLS